MKKRIALSLTALALASSAVQAQDVKVDALLIAWYTQMSDSNMRLNNAAPGGYYALGGTKGTGTVSPFNENGFSIRRSEIYLATKINDQVSANVMFDPNQPAPLLFDAFITYKPIKELEVKVGQYKAFQGYEVSTVGAADLLFIDRGQLRSMLDLRDRGIAGTFSFGDPKAFGGKVTAGVFNGETGRVNDANAQKDIIARVDFNIGSTHKFGFYTLQGETNKKDTTGAATQGDAFGAPSATNLAPSKADIYDNKDKTSNLGAYYYFNSGPWHFDAEAATGLVGRRFDSFLDAAGAAKRQHLDQKYLGYFLTGTYTTGHHMVGLRYDFMNYNAGDDWYTTYNPYTQSAPGVSRADGADYSPKFTELTLGYTYAFKPESVRAANIKADYILRSKNFLAPRTGQTGEQGGDSLVIAFQVWF